MRRLILGLLALAVITLAVEVVSAQNAPVNGFCEQGGNTITGTGNATPQKMQQSFPACTVSVFNFGTSNLSTIFSDAAGTPKGNPFTADGFGRWQYFAANGDYIVQLSGGGITGAFTLYSDVRISGATAGVGGSGTVGTLPVFTSSAAVGNSIASQVTSGKNSLIVAGGGGFPGEIDLGNVNNGNVVGFKSPANPAGNRVWTLPPIDTTGCVQSDGAFNLSISSCSGAATGITSANPIAANQIVIGQDGTRGVQQLGSLGSTTTVLHGGAGAPSFSAVSLTADVSGILPNGNLTGSGAITINGTAPITAPGSTVLGGTAAIACPTCVTSAAALTNTQIVLGSGSQATHIMASPGTTTTLLHGNAAGDPTFAAVSLTADVTGVLPQANGGFGVSTAASSGLVSVNAGTFNFNTISATNVIVGAAGNTTISATGLTYNSTFQSTTFTGLTSSGGSTLLTIAPANDTNVAANTPSVIYTAPTTQFSAASTAEQDFWQIGQPTISGSAAGKTITNTAVHTFKGLTAVGANTPTLTNNYQVWLQQGITSLTPPNITSPNTWGGLAITASLNDSTANKNYFMFQSTVVQAGTDQTQAGLFGCRSDGAGFCWGLNPYAYFNNGAANVIGIEDDHGSSSGVALTTGTSIGMVIQSLGTQPTTAHLEFKSTNGAQPTLGGIVFVGNAVAPTTSFINTNGTVNAVLNGIDFTGAIFTGNTFKSVGFLLDPAGKVGINTNAAAPGFQLRVDETTSAAIAVFNDYTFNPVILTRFARNVQSSPQGVQNGDNLGIYGMVGMDSTLAYPGAAKVGIQGVATETWSSTARGSKVQLFSTPNTTNTQTVAFTLDQSGFVGIGVQAGFSPSAPLHIGATVNPIVILDTFATAVAFIGRHAQGVPGGPTASQSGDNLGNFSWIGRGSTGYGTGGAAMITTATQTWTDVNQGTKLSFLVTPNGSSTKTTAWFIDQDGSLNGSGAVPIVLGSVAFASLGTPGNGRIIFCSDCTIANPCAGAGTGAVAKRLNGVWVCN